MSDTPKIAWETIYHDGSEMVIVDGCIYCIFQDGIYWRCSEKGVGKDAWISIPLEGWFSKEDAKKAAENLIVWRQKESIEDKYGYRVIGVYND